MRRMRMYLTNEKNYRKDGGSVVIEIIKSGDDYFLQNVILEEKWDE